MLCLRRYSQIAVKASDKPSENNPTVQNELKAYAYIILQDPEGCLRLEKPLNLNYGDGGKD